MYCLNLLVTAPWFQCGFISFKMQNRFFGYHSSCLSWMTFTPGDLMTFRRMLAGWPSGMKACD